MVPRPSKRPLKPPANGNIGLKKPPTKWPRAANTSYKIAVSWQLEESPKLKDIEIWLSISNVFQEELGKKFPEHQLKKTDVKKHLQEGNGDLIRAGQLLFEQSTLYSIKSKKKRNSKSAGYAESRNTHHPKYLARFYENKTEAHTEGLKKPTGPSFVPPSIYLKK